MILNLNYLCLLGIFYGMVLGVSEDKIRGVNIGGWFVLEPWITPSLFYPFLGSKYKIGMDMYSFCDLLGPLEANKRLQKHWNTWFNETHLDIIIQSGINLIRVPVGDWMYIPYGPFDMVEEGVRCSTGSLEMLDQLFIQAGKKNIQILLDLHTIKGSQNGFDNSGQSRKVIIHENKFIHWDIREANWVGTFDQTTKEYTSYDQESIQHSKDVLFTIIQKYANVPALYGLTILNEPWEYTPEIFLKSFYQEIFTLFDQYMPKDKVFVFHDSFRSFLWNDFRLTSPLSSPSSDSNNRTIYIDAHQYTAWNTPYESFEQLLDSTSKWQSPASSYKYIIGEWSLAIDNCEMWLNGFMDNVPNYPYFPCKYQKCPKYKEFQQELLQAQYGPFGTGISYPLSWDFTCPTTIPLREHFHLNKTEKEYAFELFQSKSQAFERQSAGWIYWNFRTEAHSYQWDYLAYLQLQNSNNSHADDNNNNNNDNNLSIIPIYFFYLLGLFVFVYIVGIFVYITRCRSSSYWRSRLHKYKYKSIPVSYKIIHEKSPLKTMEIDYQTINV